ncbi:MAG: acyl carrier protein [Pseudomonadales bacterium]|nr:acyl carrier protein [Pseudomonadales bacterium]
METLKLIWSEILDVPSEELTTSSSFFELGGSSMLLLSLHARICHEFAVEFSIQELLVNPTLEAMLRLIDAEINTKR